MADALHSHGPIALGAVGGLLTLGAAVWGGLGQINDSAVISAKNEELANKSDALAAKSDELAERSNEVKSLALKNAKLSERIAALVTGGDSMCYVDLQVDASGKAIPNLRVEGEHPVRGLWIELANLTERNRLEREGEDPQKKQHLWRQTLTQDVLRPESRLIVSRLPMQNIEPNDKQIFVISIEQLNMSIKQVCLVTKDTSGKMLIAHRVYRQETAEGGATDFAEVELLRRMDRGILVKNYGEFLDPKRLGL